MLFEFRKGNDATKATKNMCDIYSAALNICKCQRWFAKFSLGYFDLLSRLVREDKCLLIMLFYGQK